MNRERSGTPRSGSPPRPPRSWSRTAWTVGLGTGSTVAHLLPALAARGLDGSAASPPRPRPRSRRASSASRSRRSTAWSGSTSRSTAPTRSTPDGWLIKGGGGAHTREKIVAAAAERFVVIVSSDKLVDALSPPVPLELLPFGIAATLRRLEPVALRDAPPSPDGGLIADYMGAVDDPTRLAERLARVPGVVEHGLFAPELVTEILIGRGSEVERRVIRDGRNGELLERRKDDGRLGECVFARREVPVRDRDPRAIPAAAAEGDAVVRVLDRRAAIRIDVEPARGFDVDVGRRLAARDLLGGHGHP